MSDTTAKPARLSDRERALQFSLRCATVPFKEGGGIVFPAGLFGLGYRLDARQFDDCRALMEEMNLDDRTKYISRVVNAVLVFTGLVFLAGALAVAFIIFGPGHGIPLADAIFDSRLFPPLFPPLVVGGPVVVFLSMIFYPFLQRIARLRCAFADAPRTPRFSHLRRRLLAISVGGVVGPQAFLFIAILWALLGIAWLVLGMVSNYYTHGRVVIGVLNLLLAAAFSSPYWVHWDFRRKHGRAATPDDFGPL